MNDSLGFRYEATLLYALTCAVYLAEEELGVTIGGSWTRELNRVGEWCLERVLPNSEDLLDECWRLEVLPRAQRAMGLGPEWVSGFFLLALALVLDEQAARARTHGCDVTVEAPGALRRAVRRELEDRGCKIASPSGSWQQVAALANELAESWRRRATSPVPR